VALHVDLADRLAERAVDRVDAALPALALLRRAVERGAVEGEASSAKAFGSRPEALSSAWKRR
jgi:hypothetical protein